MIKVFGTILVLGLGVVPAWAGAAQWSLGKAGLPKVCTQMEHRQRLAALPRTGAAAQAMTLSPTSTLTGNWGALKHEDGSLWYYTSEVDYELTQSVVTLYDEACHEQATFTINPEIPEGVTCNVIEIFGSLSTRFFDTNPSTNEVLVYIHGYDEEHHNYSWIKAYNDRGDELFSQEAVNAQFVDVAQGFSRYQRLVLIDTDVMGEGQKPQDTYTVMRPATYALAPEVEHVFSFDSELFYYGEGPVFGTYQIGGQNYFTFHHFNQVYATLPEPDEDGQIYDYDIIVTPDNSFVVEVYDRFYNEVGHLEVSTQAPEGIMYRFPSFGMFSYEDLSKGTFTGDNQWNYIITHIDYDTATDSNLASIEAYDEAGQRLNTIGERCVDWKRLNDVPGEPVQYMVVSQLEEEQVMRIVEIPSCELVCTFGATAGGMQTSSQLDRYPEGDGYLYAIGMSEGTLDNQGRTVAYVGWFNPDATLHHFTELPLGAGIVNVVPRIDGFTLDPFLFNTDAQHEYVMLVKQENMYGGFDDVLMVANESGQVLQSFGEDPVLGTLRGVSFVEEKNPALLLNYWGRDEVRETSVYTLQLYQLPFEVFAEGGSGTVDDPYIVMTPGDLAALTRDLNACYALGADLDMRTWGKSWTPIEGFTGRLDGRGHSIDHLYVEGDGTGNFAALFGQLGDMRATTLTEISNLTLRDVTLDVASESVTHVGVIAGQAMGTTLRNIHVEGAQFTAASRYLPTVGGIVGEASNQSYITTCWVEDLELHMPGAMEVGGIVGSLKTESNLNACAVSGTLEAATQIGGIVGLAGNQSNVVISNSHARVDIIGKNTLGGILGENHTATVVHCYSEGTIQAQRGIYTGYSSGGVVGYHDGSEGALCNSCLNVSTIHAFSDGVEESDPATVRCIAGWTVDDDPWNEGGDAANLPLGLTDNYCVAAHDIDVEHTHLGYGTPVEPVAVNETFFVNTLGFSFGNEEAKPWVFPSVDGEMILPCLWFEVPGFENLPQLHEDSHYVGTAWYDLYGRSVKPEAVRSSRMPLVQPSKGKVVIYNR